MAKGKKKSKDKAPAEPKGPGFIDKALAGPEEKEEAYSDEQREMLQKLLDSHRAALAAKDPAEEEVYFEGKGGLCKYFRVSNKTVKSSSLSGGFASTMGCVICCFVCGIIGLIIDVGINGTFTTPKYHLWLILAAAGACIGMLACCFCVTCKRVVQSLETRLITDIELQQSFIQNCGKAKKAKIMLWSYDPSTPELLIKCPNGEAVYTKLREFVDANRSCDSFLEEVVIHKRRYGMQKKWLGAGILGSWGVLPTRHYNITSRKIDLETTTCTKRIKSSGSMARVYDMSGYQNVVQLCGPLVLPCLASRIALFGSGQIKMYSFDRNAMPLTIKVQDMFKVFDEIRQFIDAKNACTYYWSQARTMGILKSFITGDPQSMSAHSFTLAPIAKDL